MADVKNRTLLLLFFLLLLPVFPESDLVITTQPPGAGVFFMGRQLGTTPLRLAAGQADLLFFMNPGRKYDIIIYKEFFEGEIISVVYERGEKQQFDIELQLLKHLPLYDGIFQAGYRLNFYELISNSSKESLDYMQNEIYARHGKKIAPQFRDDFMATSWYKENPYYREDFLDETDRSNLALIDSFRNPSDEDLELTERILANRQYIEFSGEEDDDGAESLAILFNEDLTAWLTGPSAAGKPDKADSEQLFNWRVINAAVYLWDMERGVIFEAALDHEFTGIEYFQEIHLGKPEI